MDKKKLISNLLIIKILYIYYMGILLIINKSSEVALPGHTKYTFEHERDHNILW